MGVVNALKKITIKDVIKGKPPRETVQVAVLGDDGKPVLNDKGEPVTQAKSVAIRQDLALIYGRARDHRTGSTTFGPFIEYIGNFEARRIADGEVFQSTRIIFPPIADDIANEAYANAKREDPDALVDLSFVIGVEPDNKGIEGYKFTCKPIATGSNTSDPLAELRSSLAMNFAAALGTEALAKIGLAAPGENATLIEGPATEPAPEPDTKPKK